MPLATSRKGFNVSTLRLTSKFVLMLKNTFNEDGAIEMVKRFSDTMKRFSDKSLPAHMLMLDLLFNYFILICHLRSATWHVPIPPALIFSLLSLITSFRFKYICLLTDKKCLIFSIWLFLSLFADIFSVCPFLSTCQFQKLREGKLCHSYLCNPTTMLVSNTMWRLILASEPWLSVI